MTSWNLSENFKRMKQEEEGKANANVYFKWLLLGQLGHNHNKYPSALLIECSSACTLEGWKGEAFIHKLPSPIAQRLLTLCLHDPESECLLKFCALGIFLKALS